MSGSKRSCLSNEVEILKLKEQELRLKFDELNQKYNQVLMEKNILQQQNELLLESYQKKDKCSHEMSSIPVSKVSSVLSGIDFLLENQNNEMLDVISSRNQLMSVTFNALNVIERQSTIINDFKAIINNLLLTISGKMDNTAQLRTKLYKYGFDVSNSFDIYEKKRYISSIVNPRDIPTSSEAACILDSLATLNVSNYNVLQSLTQYVLGQKEKDDQLKEFKENIEANTRFLEKISTMVDAKPGIHKSIIKHIKKLKKEACSAAHAYQFAQDLVSVALAFGRSYCHDAEAAQCTARIQKWLNDGDRTIDVVQEVDFLLGLCYPQYGRKSGPTDYYIN